MAFTDISTPVVYTRRWYVLLLFSLLAMFQCTVWNTWGPVEKVALATFPSWTTSDISMFANWGNYVLFPFFVPCMVAISRSLRMSVVVGSGLMVLGTSLRCVKVIWPAISQEMFTVLCHVCAFLNGISGIIFCSAPPAVSAAWFPAGERVTATSIGQTFNGLGGGLIYLLARVMVRSNSGGGEGVQGSNSSCPVENSTSSVSVWSTDDQPFLRKEINHYIIFLAGPPVIFFILVILYFPSAPPSPPSETSQIERTSLLQGTKDLLLNKSAWLIMIVFAVSQSIPGTWGAMMVTNLSKIEVKGQCLSEEWVDLLAVVSTVATTITSIMGARLTDHLKGHMKISIICLLTSAGMVYTVLTLVSIQVIQLPSFMSLQVAIYILLVVGNCLAQANSPLLLEFAVEVCYPVSEVISGGWIFLGYGLGSMVFLLIFLIPGIGTTWLNYILPISSFICLPLLFMVKEEYRRMEVDRVKM